MLLKYYFNMLMQNPYS